MSTKKVSKKDKELKKELKESTVHSHIIIVIVASAALLLSIFNFGVGFKMQQQTNMKAQQTKVDDKNMNYPEEPEEDLKPVGKGFDKPMEMDTSYTIYIGLSDGGKDKQKLTDNEALSIITGVCKKNKIGFTVYPSLGGHIGEDGEVIVENGYVLEMDHIDDDLLHSILNDLTKQLKTGSVMVQKSKGEIFYYSNNK